MSDIDKYLWAWKNAGQSDDTVAGKLGIKPEEVAARYIAMEAAIANQQSLGIDHMIAQFNALCFQYQLLGEALKVIVASLGQTVTPQEVKEKLTEDQDKTVENLMKNFIILHPWKPSGPELTEPEEESE